MPNHEEFVDNLIKAKQEEIDREIIQLMSAQGEDALAEFAEKALWFKTKEAEKGVNELTIEDLESPDLYKKESLKGGASVKPSDSGSSIKPSESGSSTGNVDVSGVKSLSMEALIKQTEDEVAKRPWRENLEKAESKISKDLISENKKSFTKKNAAFFELANLLKIAEDDKKIESPLDLPMIDGNMEVLFAITVQNMLQPKNAQRRDAITSGQYIEICSAGAAGDFLIKQLLNSLKSSVLEKGKGLIANAQKKLSKRGQ